MLSLLGDVVVSVPATIAALAAWRSAAMTKREVTTNNGRRAGEYLEELHEDVQANTVLTAKAVATTDAIAGRFVTHEAEDERRFAALTQSIEDLGT